MADTHIEFPEPCHEDWEQMHPQGRARHCDSCDKPVHDLRNYTPEEADTLLTGAGGPACLRAHILADGRVLTKPSAVGRFLTAAIAAPAIFIALAASGAAADPNAGAISGTVKAAHAAPITVTAVAAGVSKSTQVASNGTYRLEQLPPGAYRLEFKVRKAVWWAVDGVAVRANYVTVRNAAAPPMPPPLVLRRVPPPTYVTAGVPMLPPQPAPPPAVEPPFMGDVVVTAGKIAQPRRAPTPVPAEARGEN
jgi:hypothetical protein